MSDNKVVKSLMDTATITGLVAGIGWIGRKIIKEDLTKDPSANAMNYVKFTAVMAGSIALSYVYIAPLCMRKPQLVAMSRRPSRACSYRSQRSSFWHLLTPCPSGLARSLAGRGSGQGTRSRTGACAASRAGRPRSPLGRGGRW